MEYRIHPRNKDKKLSSIGLDLQTSSDLDSRLSENNINSILEESLISGINLFHLDSQYPEILEIFSNWYNSKNDKKNIFISLSVSSWNGKNGSRDKDELLTADLDFDQIKETRDLWQFYRDRRPETYMEIVAP